MNTAASPAPPDSLRAHSDRVAQIVDDIGASTVAVLGRRGAVASGGVWRPGLVVTAAHVFRRTPAALTVVDAAGESRAATLVGMDSSTDLALFRLADANAVAPLSPAEAAPVRAGHFAIAVGRSDEGDAIASAGLVNRVGGPWQTWLGGSIDGLIRLDGGVYDGLSGAPVADADGAVMGVATAALSRSYGIVVPASTVSRVVDALLAHGRVARPWLGIGAQTVPLPEAAGAPAGEKNGLLVTSLAAGGPAERAGVLIGDIIVRAAEGAAANLRELRQALAAHVGKSVVLAVLRGGAPVELQASVAEWPGERRCW
ncbi:MAG TPA: S1C family serine protease [Caldimonas sp.]|jgi:S1-C subfamily serine protease|nr:S1C family serine protease [Caldimonas sp.]